MRKTIPPRKLSIVAGLSYLIIFFAAIFANFFALESIIQDPLEAIEQNQFIVRLGIIAFLLTAVFDVIVAWALYELYKNHPFSNLSTYFRLIHAIIMGVAIYQLPEMLNSTSSQEILRMVNTFNIIWLIGLFFFGIHLILLGKIMDGPKIISIFLVAAGIMYMIDTIAHFMLPNYEKYNVIFLAIVATTSIIGEMSFTFWILLKGGRNN
jgi:hypothetical protein